MKYTEEITIDLPREKTVELFSDPESMKKWMSGLKDIKVISGLPGKNGSKTELEFEMGSRLTTMTETIQENNLPDSFHAKFETQGVVNNQENYFEVTEESKTKWVTKPEFLFSNFMMKLMGWLMPGMFKKETRKIMRAFKSYAESQKD
ncbi:SRPBCC family protein [Salibacter halophilus]|uniref:SRPBCC family protein n=1 Tax=Salibacter halophilus TaxID=1803916 RepID=A0A6N6M788_9FLAO|nr:SRPBCC family protein [Salibacter halophilus]KAB1064473.1 SRPBCC family protein [Salibacter halophilus]